MQVIESLSRVLGAGVVPSHESPRVGDVRDSRADITAAQQAIGYTPTVSFLDGLQQTVDYLADRPVQPEPAERSGFGNE
jgi:nucleoside-diphosphate-sugar epimerase